MSDYDVLYAQQQEQMRRLQFAENSSRAAVAVSTHESVGDGEYYSPKATMFGLKFLGKPLMTQGFEVVQRPDPQVFQTPRVGAGVYRWVTTPVRAGSTELFYLGAYLVFTVDIPYKVNVVSAAAPVSRVVHHLRFDGVAMKELSAIEALLDQL